MKDRTERIGILTSSWAAGGLCVLLMAATPLRAQGFEWPEQPENLTVLTDFTGEQLAPVMRGFTRALGVRCSFCHVGEEGQPLSTYDFASDDNEKKRTARTMLRMLGVINDSISSIDWGDQPKVNMWCHTCHRGRPRPMTLAEELGEVYQEQGVEPALRHYEDLRARFYGRGSYDFGEGSLNEFGYQAMAAGDYDAALSIFQRNAKLFSQSGNVYDSLGEAYAALGDTTRAIENYERAVELDPRNRNAARRLRELRGG
ncbi:MAG: c-type cytochrome [Gemmatimonadales bacterium]